MVRAITVGLLLALLATTDAAVCRHKPRPSVSAAPAASQPASSDSVLSSAPAAPAISDAVSTSGSLAEGTGSATTSSESAATPSSGAVSSFTVPPPAATAPSDVNKSEPWIIADPNDNRITANPSADDIAGNTALTRWFVEYHNQFRAEFDAGPVSWDAGLAQESADHTKTCKWEHQGADNLAAWWGTGSSALSLPATKNLFDGWAKEWPDSFEDRTAQKANNVLNHFTMMVWKDVKAIGCSWNVDCREPGFDKKVYLTCKYSPTGNYVGQAVNQVGPFVGNK